MIHFRFNMDIPLILITWYYRHRCVDRTAVLSTLHVNGQNRNVLSRWCCLWLVSRMLGGRPCSSDVFLFITTRLGRRQIFCQRGHIGVVCSSEMRFPGTTSLSWTWTELSCLWKSQTARASTSNQSSWEGKQIGIVRTV